MPYDVDPMACIRCQIIEERILEHQILAEEYKIRYEEQIQLVQALSASFYAHEATNHEEDGLEDGDADHFDERL